MCGACVSFEFFSPCFKIYYHIDITGCPKELLTLTVLIITFHNWYFHSRFIAHFESYAQSKLFQIPNWKHRHIWHILHYTVIDQWSGFRPSALTCPRKAPARSIHSSTEEQHCGFSQTVTHPSTNAANWKHTKIANKMFSQ